MAELQDWRKQQALGTGPLSGLTGGKVASFAHARGRTHTYTHLRSLPRLTPGHSDHLLFGG